LGGIATRCVYEYGFVSKQPVAVACSAYSRDGVFTKSLRQEKESLEKELSLMRRNRGNVPFEQQRLEKQLEALLAERDIIRAKVEAMLDAVAVLDPELAEDLR